MRVPFACFLCEIFQLIFCVTIYFSHQVFKINMKNRFLFKKTSIDLPRRIWSIELL